MRADYQCKSCSKIVEYVKPYGENFPEEIDSLDSSCEQKNCRFKRLFNYVPVIDVAVGLTGNASNGYTDENVYKSSSFSPNRLNDYPSRHKYQHNEQ